jgi:hypothetical protein
MKKIFLFLLICCGLMSCNEHPNKFQTIIKATNSDFKEIPFSEITKSGFFHSIGDYIIMQDIYSSDKGIFIFEKNNLKYITKTGKIGKGPKEIGRYGPIFCSKNNFFVSDYAKQKIWRFNIDSVVSYENYRPTSVFDFKFMDDIDPFQFFIKYDTLYFMSMDNSFFKKYDSPETTISIGKNKFSHQRLSNMESLHKSPKQTFTMKPSYTKFAFAFRYDNTIITLDKNLNIENKYIEEQKPIFNNDPFSDKIFYGGLKSDSINIFAAYLNGKPLLTKDEKYGHHEANWPNTIRVFDWNCNPQLEFQIESSFSDFLIDSENNRLIIYQLDSEKPLKYFNYDKL